MCGAEPLPEVLHFSAPSAFFAAANSSRMPLMPVLGFAAGPPSGARVQVRQTALRRRIQGRG
jgi:hypothetical protein